MIKRIIALTLCLLMIVSNLGYAQATTVEAVEAPKNVTVELKNYPDGLPYFLLNVGVPASVEDLGQNAIDQGDSLFYEVEYKVGNGDWQPTGGVHFDQGNQIIMNPDDMGLNGNVDIKANVYSFRVKFGYYAVSAEDENGNRVAAGEVFSPYSNIATIGIDSYQITYKDASTWAVPELDKAAEYEFITDKIKDKMNGPITREELCEVIMKMYEKFNGEAKYSGVSSFSDTKNPEIYKAYELGIVNGVGNGKFAPKELTNREQVAAMMYRAVKVINPGADLSTVGAEKFADEKLISSWALEPVKFMSKNALLKGSNGYVNPKGTTTREQAVLLVLRTYEKYSK